MSKRAFEKIAEGLDQAIEIARGERKPSKLYIPPEIDVKDLRRRLKLSQDDFATTFGFTLNQIREWEQGRSRPIGGVRAYLMMICLDPEGVQRILATARVSKAKAA